MYTPTVKSSRQQAKEKAKALKELYFLIQWEDRDKEDGHDLLDVLPAKAIVVDSDADLELLGEGDDCQALFNKKMYPATIVGSGTYQEMKSTQEEMDTLGPLHARESSDIFEVAEDDMDITVAAVPEDVVEISGAQLDDYKDDASGRVAGSIGTPKRGAVKKGRPKAAKSPKPVKSPKGVKSPKRAPKSPKRKKKPPGSY